MATPALTRADVFLAWLSWLTGQPSAIVEASLQQQAGVKIRATAFAREEITRAEFDTLLAEMKRESPAVIFEIMKMKGLPKLRTNN